MAILFDLAKREDKRNMRIYSSIMISGVGWNEIESNQIKSHCWSAWNLLTPSVRSFSIK
jgi:hypothetical protein